jgi:putative GTP pyrophosphokinase
MIESKTQIDRLGDRLKQGVVQETDLRQLDTYRRSFAEAYDTVVAVIRRELGMEPTGRPAKSTSSIAEKLRRETIRLSQMQDIAGCRLVEADVTAQDNAVTRLNASLPNAEVIDRRVAPSHGYRAVHVLPTIADRCVEIQIRTEAQHLWAEISEKLADLLDPEIKYGRGYPTVQKFLHTMSSRVDEMEALIALRAATLSAGQLTAFPRHSSTAWPSMNRKSPRLGRS